jgi:putative nucleotidyltransferase with HDIG domain
MEEKQVFARIDRLEILATMPEVISEVMRFAEDDSAPLDALANVVLKDAPLTVRIIAAANSSLYGRNLRSSNVRDAIMTLGARSVKSIALSHSLIDVINRIDSQVHLKTYWKHSIEVAIISELIAKKIGLREREEAYIAGLFHDIGVLVLDSCFPREYAHVWKGAQHGDSLIKLEEMLFSTNHCKVGSYLLSLWNLPEVYPSAIINHHDTVDLKEPDQNRMIPQIVNLAERIARYHLDSTQSLKDFEFDNRKIIMKNLGLSQKDMADIEFDVMQGFLDAASFLEIDVGSPTELLSEANMRMFKMYRELEDILSTLKSDTNYTEQMEYDRLAVEVLHTVVATFSHYFNNACASILGRAQLIEMAVNKGELKDHNNVLNNSLFAIQNGVTSITGTIAELKRVKTFKTTLYHDKTLILDLEDALKKYKPDPQKSKTPQKA